MIVIVNALIVSSVECELILILKSGWSRSSSFHDTNLFHDGGKHKDNKYRPFFNKMFHFEQFILSLFFFFFYSSCPLLSIFGLYLDLDNMLVFKLDYDIVFIMAEMLSNCHCQMCKTLRRNAMWWWYSCWVLQIMLRIEEAKQKALFEFLK